MSLRLRATSYKFSTAALPAAALCAILVLPTIARSQIAVVERNVNLRPEPSSDPPVIRKLRPPEEVLLIELAPTSGYLHVRTEPGEIGWIWSRQIRIEDRLPDWDDANIPDYDRDEWRHWIDADEDCQDTRREVLIRDADAAIAFAPRADGRQCRVVSGSWINPYGGETLSSPSQVQTDHVVPLENTHRSGGWAWAKERKEAFANELVDPQHLLAVNGSLNQSKGSRGPERWLPPDTTFFCEYATMWERIKTNWRLAMTDEERTAVATTTARCP